jgi:hypothetical protein
LTVKFNPSSILFARKSVVFVISGAYLVHNKKMNVHIIDSNSVMIDEEMTNTTAKDNRNNFSFCWQADKKYYKKL